MKRFFLVNEYFGSRVYDSLEKKEKFYNHEDTKIIKETIKGNYTEINNIIQNNLSAPLKISMNITKSCNLRCKQCFSNSGEIKEKELTTEDMFNLFDNMKKYGTFFICLGGGEPLIRPDLLEILEHGKKNQLAISIVSNGLLLTKELIHKLNDKNIDTFWISLDGLKENHEYLRGSNTFDKTKNAIKLLKQEFNSKIAIRISLSNRNIHEYKDLLKIAEKLNVDIIRFTPLLSFGRAKNENLTISQEQYINFLNEIEKIEPSITVIHPNVTNNSKFWISPENFGCHCGKEAMWLDEVGNYSPCIFYGDDYIIGNIKNENYMRLWRKCLAISNYKGNDVCKSCENYKRCRGGCRARVLALEGNLNGIDPLCPLKKNLI